MCNKEIFGPANEKRRLAMKNLSGTINSPIAFQELLWRSSVKVGTIQRRKLQHMEKKFGAPHFREITIQR
jgi:hypothetical protein